MFNSIVFTGLLAMVTTAAQAQVDAKAVTAVVRTPILGAQLAAAKTIDHVRGVSVSFTPGQHTGRHEHPIPVVGYVVGGTIAFQVAGQPARLLKAGEAFYEPADTVIEVFDNASSSEPASFIGFYLLGAGETEVVRPAR